jgi:hypothetical protein
MKQRESEQVGLASHSLRAFNQHHELIARCGDRTHVSLAETRS